jgi:hypothetical protein
VRRELARTVRLLILPTLGLGVVVAFIPGRLGLAVRIYALVVCGAALALALTALRAAYPAETPLQRRVKAASEQRRPPSSLGQIEHEAALGVAGSFDLHYRLVPRLRSIAGGLLSSRRRISLGEQQAAAREVVGEETWGLVRPDRQAPENRLGPGLSPQELSRVVGSLERV